MNNINGEINWNPEKHDRLQTQLEQEKRERKKEKILANVRDYWKKWEKRDQKAKAIPTMISNLEELERACIRLVGDNEDLQDWLAGTKELLQAKIETLKVRKKGESES
jgi:hypothetical protein